VAVALGVIGVTLRARGIGFAAPVAGFASAVLAVAALVPQLVRWWRRAALPRPAPTTADIERAKDILAGLIDEQWKTEATIRSLDDPYPIPVIWRLTEHDDLMDRSSHISSGVLAFSGRSDRISGLANEFRRLRRRRLVILGAPGAGKTTLAVQMLLEFVSTRAPGEPVPVLLPVASWDTTAYPTLRDWLAIRLSQDYPALRAQEQGPDLPQALAARAQILPLLDGLDELSDPSRSEVIAALNRSLRADDQVILTCRTSEFTATIAVGDVLKAAAVIEAEALTPAAAATYLENCLPRRPDQGWQTVLANLRAKQTRNGPAAALTEITTTPLGAWLLRAVYITARRDPAPLLNGDLCDARMLRAHLFDQLIPALISSRPPTDDPADVYRPLRERDPDDVRRWLGYLAYYLTRFDVGAPHQTRDFAWWEIARRTLGPGSLRLVIALGAGLVAGLGFGLVAWLGTGLAAGIGAGRVTGLWAGLGTGLGTVAWLGIASTDWRMDSPGYADLRLRRRPSPSNQQVKAAGHRHGFSRMLRRMVGAGLGAGLLAALAAGSGAGLVFGFVFGLGTGLGTGLAFGLVAGLVQWAETPATTDRASTPLSSWRADRTLILMRMSLTAVAFGIAYGILSGVLFGLVTGLVAGLVAGPVVGLVAGLVVGRHHAWAVHVVATFQLARGGHLPRRLMLFLDDAHRLGLLRAVGSIYQFRHAELQDHLAREFLTDRTQRTMSEP
jgi:NACHT domain